MDDSLVGQTVKIPFHLLTIPRSQLDIDDYLSASSDASSRTRSILFIMVVASVLAMTGLFNSLQSQWMHKRMIALGDPKGTYIISKIGQPPDASKMPAEDFKRATELYNKRQESLCTAVENAYVEGSFVIKVPFFGITFDVNDLGIVAGVGFMIILSCYRFFLSREIDNLRISFTAARIGGDDQLASFYSLLAMRQVFTIPDSGFINRSKFLRYWPKFITWVPVSLQACIVAHDIATGSIGQALSANRFLLEVFTQFFCIGIVGCLAFSITVRLFWMDEIWNAVAAVLALKGASAQVALDRGSATTVDAETRWNKAFRA